MDGATVSQEAENLAREGRRALRRGDRQAARHHAMRALEDDQTCELAWLVLAALSDPHTRRHYLEHVLSIHPNSVRALHALTLTSDDRRLLEPSPFPPSGGQPARGNGPSLAGATLEDTRPIAPVRRSAAQESPGRELLSNLRVVAVSCEMALKHAATDAFIIFAVFVQPLIIALLGLYMLRARGGDYAIFVVVGSGLTGLWSSLLFVSGGALNQERWIGTLESLVGMPTSLEVIVFGKNLAYVTQSLGSMVLAYALASILFGTPLTVAQPLVFFVSIGFTTISFVCFGLLLAPMFVANPDIRNFVNALEYPMYILAGFLFPIALLPGWTTPLSYLLAPYWAAEALHAASAGTATLATLTLDWGMMLALGAAYVLVGRWLFRVFLRKARQDATLDFI